MVKVISAFRGGSPLGDTLAQLGQQMFGDQATGAINRAKQRALERQNVETENYMRRVAEGGGMQALGSDPVTQAMIIGAGYDPGNAAQLGLMGAANQYGAADQRTQNWQVGAGQPYTNTAGAFETRMAEDRRNNDQQSTDRRYGVDTANAREQDQWSNTPMPVLDQNGRPVYAPRWQLAPTAVATDGVDGMDPQTLLPSQFSPILSDAERKGVLAGANFGHMGDLPAAEQSYLGADGASRTPRNWLAPDGSKGITLDGLTDSATRRPIPPGSQIYGTQIQDTADNVLSPRAKGQIDQGLLELGTFDIMGRRLREVASNADPRLFGASGRLIDFGRGVATLASNLYATIGVSDAEGAKQWMLQDIQNEIARQKANGQVTLDPSVLNLLFSPDSAELELLAGLYVYQAAKAIANQEGRGLSNEDVQRFTSYIGSPQDWSMDKTRYLQKLNAVDNLTRKLVDYFRQARGLPPLPSQDAGGEAAPGPAMGDRFGDAFGPMNGASPMQTEPPPDAVEYLRQHPELAPQFDEKYGPGAAARVVR